MLTHVLISAPPDDTVTHVRLSGGSWQEYYDWASAMPDAPSAEKLYALSTHAEFCDEECATRAAQDPRTSGTAATAATVNL